MFNKATYSFIAKKNETNGKKNPLLIFLFFSELNIIKIN